MLKKNYAMNILLENASTYSDKTQLHMLSEAEQAVVNDKMVANIYQSALKKRDVDFDNIPFTKGDIQKFHGYDNMIGTLNVVKELSKKFGIKIEELNVVDEALGNIRAYRGVFEKGFALDVDFLQTYYNSLVYACVESTSLILSSYVEYVKTINTVEFTLKKGKGIYGNICLDNLRKFNISVKKGEFSKFANGLLNKDRQDFTGGTVVAAAAIGLAVNIVPIAREIIYYMYESRMKVSEYLDQQAEFLEMNNVRLNSSAMAAPDRNRILDKQTSIIRKLEGISDRIRVNHQLADKSASTKLKQDNKQWTLNSVSGNDDGFMFI